jgi:hypothetical protein
MIFIGFVFLSPSLRSREGRRAEPRRGESIFLITDPLIKLKQRIILPLQKPRYIR